MGIRGYDRIVQLQSGSGCLKHLFRFGPCGYGLRRDIACAAEHTLLMLPLSVRLDGRLDNDGGVPRTTLVDQTEGKAFDALTLIRGGEEIVQ